MINAERIFWLIEVDRITQKQLADAIGVYPSTITDWKNGKTKSFNSKHKISVANFFGVPAEKLIPEGSKPMIPAHRIEPLRKKYELQESDLSGVLNQLLQQHQAFQLNNHHAVVLPEHIKIWEADLRIPDSHILVCLSDFFNVSFQYIAGETENGTHVKPFSKLSSHLVKARSSKGLTRSGLATITGIPTFLISFTELDYKYQELYLSQLVRLANYFETTLDYLVGKTNSSDLSSELSEDESNMLDYYRALSSKDKDLFKSEMLQLHKKGRVTRNDIEFASEIAT